MNILFDLNLAPFMKTLIDFQEVFRCSELRVLKLGENDLAELSPAVASLLWLEELYLEKNGEC